MASLRHNPVSDFILGPGSAQQPGVGGPLRDVTHPLQQDPITGYWYDPQTGTSYLDGTGQQPITNPNIAQQVATNFQHSQAFLGNLGGLEEQRQQVFGDQTNLAHSYNDILTGRAPSVAGIQATQQAQQGAQQQLSQAASIGGASSPVAQIMAARNTAQIQGDAMNAATLAKAKEQTDARTGLTQLLHSMGMGVETTAQRDTTAATNFGQMAGNQQGDLQNLNRQANKDDADQSFKLGGAGINAISSAIG